MKTPYELIICGVEQYQLELIKQKDSFDSKNYFFVVNERYRYMDFNPYIYLNHNGDPHNTYLCGIRLCWVTEEMAEDDIRLYKKTDDSFEEVK